MLEVWDKLNYNENLGPRTPWDFSTYIPQVVIIALGQNDSNPVDFMQQDPAGTLAQAWKRDYKHFISLLREKYPRAHIILTTTVLCHCLNWDDALDDIVQDLSRTDERVHHFRFRRTGIATPGHPRIAEHNEMARELTAYLASFGDSLWEA